MPPQTPIGVVPPVPLYQFRIACVQQELRQLGILGEFTAADVFHNGELDVLPVGADIHSPAQHLCGDCVQSAELPCPIRALHRLECGFRVGEGVASVGDVGRVHIAQKGIFAPKTGDCVTHFLLFLLSDIVGVLPFP